MNQFRVPTNLQHTS